MDSLPPITGEDPAFLDVIERVSALAQVEKPCLIVGERGTGKELFTSRVHYLSPRWENTLLKVNCAALTETLLDTELFGHEAGAFTGAVRRHVGCFERADGGTLILDEIASASLAVQEKILRVIEYGELQRVGGNETIEVDVRIVAASNVDLPGLAERHEFRPDLLDRLAFDVVTLPPLRARPADVMPLALNFAVDSSRELGRELFPGFSRAAEDALLAYAWPGNVRELKNVVERSLYRTPPDELVDDLVFDPFESPWRPGAVLQMRPEEGRPDAALARVPGPSAEPSLSAAIQPEPALLGQGQASVRERAEDLGYTTVVADFERQLLQDALTANEFNQTATAQALQLSYHQLRRLIKKYDLV